MSKPSRNAIVEALITKHPGATIEDIADDLGYCAVRSEGHYQ